MHLITTAIIFLGAAHQVSSYAISATTASVEILTKPISTAPCTKTKDSLTATAKAVTALSTSASNEITNVTLPSLPLNSSSLSALNSLMNFILSTPDEILQAGDADLKGFYTNISSCLSNVTRSVEDAAKNLGSEVAGIAQEVGSAIKSEAGKAASLFGSLTSDIPGAISTAQIIESKVGSAIKSEAGKATSFIGSLTSDIPGAVSTARGIAQSIESQVVTAAPALVTEATSLFHNIASDAGAAAKSAAAALHLPFKPRAIPRKRQFDIPTYLNSSFFNITKRKLPLKLAPKDLSSTLSQLSTISTCLSTAANSDPLFEAGNCAFHIAELVAPAGKILKIKKLIGGSEGIVKTVQTLGNAADAASVVKIGGKGVLDLLKEVSGLGDVVKDCSFLV